MKLTAGILLVFGLSLSARTVSQTITFSGKDVSLEEVFAVVKQQTGYAVVGKLDILKDPEGVTVDAKDMELGDFLEAVLKGRPYEFNIKSKTIFIRQKQGKVNPVAHLKQKVSPPPVSGVIRSTTGQPLAGATVRVKGENISATSNEQGRFEINADVGSTLIISYVGYIPAEIKIDDLTTYNIQLKVLETALEEVVINKGYYIERQKLSTGSVGKVTAKDIGRQPVSNPLQALYAKVPGLVVTQATGIQGGNFNVEIRGQNSLRRQTPDNGNLPLYVIDGVPFNSAPLNLNPSNPYPLGINGTANGVTGASPFNNLNPAEIESIEILKDADATAIYGSRGANGVVLITTKKGKVEQMKVDLNIYSGVGRVTRKMNLLNTEQYLAMRREAYQADNITNIPANAYDINGTWEENKYTDWQHELIGGTARVSDAQISVSGGSLNTQYRIGGGYHRETTVFPGDFNDHRASMHISMSNNSTNQKFRSQVSVSYSLNKTNLFVQDLTSMSLGYVPNAPDLLDAKGDLNWPTGVSQNPLQYTKQPYNAKTNNLIGSLNLSYEIARGIELKANLGYSTSGRREVSKMPVSTIAPAIRQFFQNSSQFGNNTTSSWIAEPQLHFRKRFNRHDFNALVGGTFQDQGTESLGQDATGFASEALMDNVSAVPGANISNRYSIAEYRYAGLYGRINYNYNNKYIVNLTARRDGSSRFGPGKQFANFAAIGTAWIFSEENWFKSEPPALSFGKLRGSFGLTGSDQTPDYAFLDLYSTSYQYDGIQGLEPTRLYNPDFAWEENKKLEIGIELGFLNDKLFLTTAWYRNRSSNQLVGYPLPPNTGFPTVTSNLNATVENKGLEFELNGVILKHKNFGWSGSFNITFPRNKLVSFPNIKGSSYENVYVVGQPLNIVKVYEYTGIDQNTGLYQVKDVDSNGVFNTIDRHIARFLGQKFSGGFNNRFQWRGLELDILFQLVKQEGRNYSGNFSLPGSMQNQPVNVLNRWEKTGDLTSVQRFSTNRTTQYTRYISSDAVITDASFIRLKNVALSYTLPSRFYKAAKLKNARVYMQAQNLLTITKYTGLDPETQGATLPPLTFVTAGIQLIF